MPKQKDHPVHAYYQQADKSSTCKICDFSVGSKNTTNLVSHLKKHKTEYAAYLEKKNVYDLDKEKETTTQKSDTKAQLTIKEMWNAPAPAVWDDQHPRTGEVLDSIAQMIIADGLPFTVSHCGTV